MIRFDKDQYNRVMIKLPSYVTSFMDRFKKAHFQIYIVGGSVRDLLRASVHKDWDFATSATPEEILKLYPDGFYNNQFGTVGVNIEDNDTTHLFEVTTFRREGEYQDARHPDKVEWAQSIEEDLARRDFTINAIAYDGEKITDPYDGQEHLKQKLIVAVGDPNIRFSEDALRLMRAVRLATQLGFSIDEKTKASIEKNAHLLSKVSGERIRDELVKILSSDNPADGILLLKDTGLLNLVLSEVVVCFDVPQVSPKRHHIYDVGTHLVMALKYTPSKDPITRLATLLHDIGKAKTFRKDESTQIITFYNHEVVGEKQAAVIADRLRLSKKDKHKLLTLIRHHQFTVSETQTDKAVRRFIHDVGKEYIQDMLDLRTGDRLGSGATETSWRLELFKKRLEEVQKHVFSVTDLKINGNDVMKELNIKPGPKIGEILTSIFQEVEEGRLKNERDILLHAIVEYKKS